MILHGQMDRFSVVDHRKRVNNSGSRIGAWDTFFLYYARMGNNKKDT